MYLFDQKNSQVEVFSLEANKAKISSYKKAEIERIPEDQRFLIASTNFDPILSGSKRTLTEREVNYVDNVSYHELSFDQITDSNRDNFIKILKIYYNSTSGYNPYKILAYKDSETGKYMDRKYLLPTSGYERKFYPAGDYTMKYILNITESLYFLGNFLTDLNTYENHKYDPEFEYYAQEFLKLCDFKGPIDTFDYKLIPKLYNVGFKNMYKDLNNIEVKSERYLKILKR